MNFAQEAEVRDGQDQSRNKTLQPSSGFHWPRRGSDVMTLYWIPNGLVPLLLWGTESAVTIKTACLAGDDKNRIVWKSPVPNHGRYYRRDAHEIGIHDRRSARA